MNPDAQCMLTRYAGTPDPDRRQHRERPISTGSGLTLDSEELDESSLATADSPDTSHLHLHLDPVRLFSSPITHVVTYD